MSETNNLIGQILTMRGALHRIDGMCSEAGRYNEIVADRTIDRVQEIARKALGNDVEIDEVAAALAAKDAEIERLTRERDEAEHDADEKGHWYRVTEAENERLRGVLYRLSQFHGGSDDVRQVTKQVRQIAKSGLTAPEDSQ